MNKRALIKKLLPPFILDFLKVIRPKRKIQKSPLRQIEHHSDRIIIIGNGPSLNESVRKYKNEILNSDRIAVNYFAYADLYEELKPTIYVFADPDFINIPDKLKDYINGLIDNIVNKTTWPLHVVVPYMAKDSFFVTRILSNKNIFVNYFYNGWQDVGRMPKFEAWDKNLNCPTIRNVMHLGIYLAVFWNYKEVYLIGADYSFIELFYIDQETNKLYLGERHFYKEYSELNKKLESVNNGSATLVNMKLHEKLYNLSINLKCFEDLNEYAKYKGVKLYNASEYSWIDTLDRKKL